MLGLVEAYSFWWSSQLICRDDCRDSTVQGITQTSCGVNFIRMSRLVLAGLVPQEVIPDSMRMLRSLRTFIVAISRREMAHPQLPNLSTKIICSSLGRFFPTATHEAGTSNHALSAVVDVVERENPSLVSWVSVGFSTPLHQMKVYESSSRIDNYACRAGRNLLHSLKLLCRIILMVVQSMLCGCGLYYML